MSATASGDDACRRAAPPGVHRGHGTLPLVHQQHGNAVGGLDGHYAARLVFEQRVALSEQPGAAFGSHARRGVDLFQGGQLAKQRGNIGQARAEAVHQPWQRVELSDAIDLLESR